MDGADRRCLRLDGAGVPSISFTSRQEFKMVFILIVAGTALAFYAAAMFIIERENAAT